ncbi:hypothetical protein DDE23_18740 [Pararhodobacter aggregans]|uniref:Uncharacterized protein n=2 Tax=Pararhodobacter aggregans TaxID=404875 RepID=A0A2T7UMJ6_9RHOB|nr:hypothetical protein DDE23_18740 [Pararhodobacter aggregans]
MRSALVCAMTFALGASTSALAQELVALSGDQDAAIHSVVSSRLREPESAQFRDVIAATDPSLEGMIWVCGMVAGRNGFGGISDFAPFMGSLVTENSGQEQFVLISLAGQQPDEQERVLNTCLARMPRR